MLVKNINDLKDGQTYWYVSVENNCHWNVKVSKDVYRMNPQNYSKCMNSKSVWDMILFDNEHDAQALAKQIQNLVNPYIIR